MDSQIVKTTMLNGGLGGSVQLEETRDGRRHIRKTYINNTTLITEEWNALVFLYNAGFNVPQPYKKAENSIYMQYIDGETLWNGYQAADTAVRQELTDKFVKLLYDLHNIKPNSVPNGGFIENELAEIKDLIPKHRTDYLKTHSKLETLSKHIEERQLCYIHRDYHPWNVLMDKNQKLYVIDMPLRQGDYRFDVAWTYALMSRSGFEEFASAFLSGYYKLKPDARDDFDYFIQLVNLRWLVNVYSDSPNSFFRPMIEKAEQAIIGEWTDSAVCEISSYLKSRKSQGL